MNNDDKPDFVESGVDATRSPGLQLCAALACVAVLMAVLHVDENPAAAIPASLPEPATLQELFEPTASASVTQPACVKPPA